MTIRRWVTPLRVFVAAAVVSTVVIAAAGLWASQRSGRSEAIEQATQRTLVVAKTVVEPNLSPDLVAGDPAALATFDALVTGRVLDESTVRVKLWDQDGVILYSDDSRLIGERYPPGQQRRESIATGDAVAETSDLEGPEHRFERTIAGEMLQVYFPLSASDGELLLYEAYFDAAAVDASASRIRSESTPILFGALALAGLLHLGFAAMMSSRLRRDQRKREELLQRAIEASDLERRRIAADLDAGVVRNLLEAFLDLGVASDKARDSSPELVDDLRRAAASTQRSVHALRGLLVDIYPSNLHEQGLAQALQDLLAPAAGLGIETEVTFASDSVAPETTALVFRVIQESVRNVFRHSQATRLSITLEDRLDEQSAAWTIATIDDNGSGLSSSQVGDARLGLRLLSDLTRDAGARFAMDARPGEGTRIRVEVPVSIEDLPSDGR